METTGVEAISGWAVRLAIFGIREGKEELRSVGWSQDPEEIQEVLMVIKVHDTMSTFLSNLAAFSRWLELLQEKVSIVDVWPRIAR